MAGDDDFDFGSISVQGSSESGDLRSELAYNRQRSECTSGASTADTADKKCVVCDEERASKKTKYCNTHRRAYDCIQRQCMKGHTKEHPTKEGADFLQIFGDGKSVADETTAARVLMDFVRMFPEGQSKTTKKRGPIDICQYVHAQGVKKYCGDRGTRPKLDYEAFICRMKTARGWSAQKSDLEWNKMRSNELIGRDNLGPPDAPLRLYVPSWMVAEDVITEGVDSFEEKVVQTMSKAGKLSLEDKQALLSETALGFSRLSAPESGATGSACASVDTPLLPGAVTGAASGNVASLVATAAAGIRELGADGGKAKVEVSPMKAGQPAGANAQTKPRPDIARMRNTTNLVVTRDFSDMKRKLGDAIIEAEGILQQQGSSTEELFYKTVEERRKLALAFLGVELKAKAGDAGTGGNTSDCFELVPTKFMVPAGDGGQQPSEAQGKDQVEQHSMELKRVLDSMPIKPIESPDDLESSSAIAEYISTIPVLCMEGDVEKVSKKWEKAKILLQQLLNALKAASRDLRGAIERRAKQEMREKRKAAAEAEAKAKKVADKKAQEARKQLAGGKDSRIFCIKWEENGHLAIPSFADDSELKQKFDDGGLAVLSEPFIVQQSQKFKDTLNTGKKFAEACDKWQKKFPEAPQCKGPEKRTAAPLTSAHGAEELEAVWEAMVPSSMQIVHGQPSLKALMEKPWLVGYMPDLVLTAFEADFMGSIRLQLSGAMSILAIPAAGAAQVVKRPEVSALCDVTTLFDEKTIHSLPEKGLRVMHGTLACGSVLVVPPGFIVCATTANAQPAAFARKSFLCKGAECLKNLGAIAGRVGGTLAGETLSLKSTLEIVQKESST